MKSKKTAAGFLALALTLGTWNLPAYGENVRMNEMKYHEMSYDEELQEAAQSLAIDNRAPITNDLILPSSYGIHVSIEWKSSDEKRISNDGHVHIPSVEDGDKKITLTALLSSTKTSSTLEKTFEVTVKAMNTEELLNKEATQVHSYINYILNDGYTLPDSSDIGITSDISWSVLSGEAVIDNHVLNKTSASAQRQPLALRAVLKQGSLTRNVDISNLVLIDKYAGYVMSFFGGNDDKKTVHLAYSYDGEHFYPLNDGNTILKTSKKRLNYQELRDPFIMRKKDGSFAVLATNGWNSTDIYLWDSDDLISFTNERTSVLSAKGTVGLSGFHTWAPECNYDPVTDSYTVYWSDPEADNGYGKTFCNTSTDLVHFSGPEILYDAGSSIIDASIKKYNGYYYLVYNDAYGDNETGKGGKIIYMAKSASLEPGSFRQISGAMSPAGTLSEGPFLFENFRTGGWYVMYDHYSLHKYGVAVTDNLTSDNWNYLGVSNTMPTENIRHGGVIPVTKAELQAVIDAYRISEPPCAKVVTPDAVRIPEGSTKLVLPDEVNVILADGWETSRPVTWDTSQIKTDKTGTYTASGKVSLNNVSDDAVTPAAIEVQVTEDAQNGKSFPWVPVTVLGSTAVLLGCGALVMKNRRKKQD